MFTKKPTFLKHLKKALKTDKYHVFVAIALLLIVNFTFKRCLPKKYGLNDSHIDFKKNKFLIFY